MQTIQANNKSALYSMEVAAMVEKTHANLMKDIRRYCQQLAEVNNNSGDNVAEVKINSGDFFQEATYKDGNNQSRPCYLVTKNGCEFIAHKLTGAKGTAFTARYIMRFHEMEQELSQKQLEQSNEPKQQQLPRANYIDDWYLRNKDRIKEICDHMGWKREHLYHKILKECWGRYDYKSAVKKYADAVGEQPKDVMDVLAFFYDTQKFADSYLDFVEENYLY